MDYLVRRLIDRSAATIKASAARYLYDAAGDGIVWAVLDSGMDGAHLHFDTHRSLSGEVADLRDFTGALRPFELLSDDGASAALTDSAGHGTHVAGIIAGAFSKRLPGRRTVPPLVAEHIPVSEMLHTKTERLDLARIRTNEHAIEEFTELEEVDVRTIGDPARLSGIAPRCKLVSLKVLDEEGEGRTSNVIMALRYGVTSRYSPRLSPSL